MNLRSIFGFLGPKLLYSEKELPIEDFPVPEKAVLLFNGTYEDGLNIKVDDQVKTGQKLCNDKAGVGFYSSVTGKVTGLSELNWLEGKKYILIDIETSGDEWDSSAQGISDFQSKKPDELINNLKDLGYNLSNMPSDVETVVINGFDTDLLIAVNSAILKEKSENINKGIDLIKHLTGANRVVIAVSDSYADIAKNAVQGKAEVETVDLVYPNGLPELLPRIILKNSEDVAKCYVVGIEYLNSIVESVTSGKPCVEKVITLIDKGSNPLKNLRVRIGTPISKILEQNSISVDNNNKIILGGPMKGKASYMTDFPITNSIDSVYIQGKEDIIEVTNASCINCGKCVEVCPNKLPVNLLSRYSEFGIFENCVDLDIDYCIECGMCSYVCVSRRPLVQFIQFAKKELSIIEENEKEEEE